MLERGIFILLALALTIACTNEEAVTKETVTTENTKEGVQKPIVKGYQVGDVAEDFKLKNVDGNFVSMADFPDAKGFVIVFTCNHCPYSIAYEDRLIELDEKYKTLGYPVIAINPNDPAIVPEDSYENMILRAQEKEFTFPYLIDEEQKIYPKYGATKTPHVYVVNKTDEGNKVAYIGAIDDSKNMAKVTQSYLVDALDALLKGEKPEPNFTKAFGCSVKAEKKS
ncbi:thioredoxin family protein [Aureispira anguillae]|uniref:Thioredoxin family protein n=1 Tax=Aureispira anguillae TaxID=2864201 RepID=A0A916DWL7_9BACT|nr:thioredoxin family protein [Aureispira anguillae]BDS14156.1 thioredoxin family protein [Aureispira anguillae]